MKAAILAGGAGIRLRPLTYVYPKVMMPLGGRPLLEHTIEYLKGQGVSEIVLCVAYLRSRIKEYFHDGADFGVRLSYAEADEPLGTAGQLLTAKDTLNETFVVMNGDILTNLNIADLMKTHASSKNTATIAIRKMTSEVPYGCVDLDDSMRMTGFREKPVLTYLANSGIYVMNPKIFEYIRCRNMPLDLERDVFPAMISSGERLGGYASEASWAHIGSVADLERIDKELFSNGNHQAKPELNPVQRVD